MTFAITGLVLAASAPAADAVREPADTIIARADADAAKGDYRAAGSIISQAIEQAIRDGNLPAFLSLSAREIAICRMANDRRCEAKALMNGGVSNAEAGRAGFALAQFQQSAALSRELKDTTGVVIARFNAANARRDLSDPDGALAELREIDPALRELGFGVPVDLTLADLFIDVRRPVAALDAVARVRQAARPSPTDTYYWASSQAVKADALAGLAFAELRHPTEADAAFKRALARASTGHDIFETKLSYARALDELGRARAALPVLAEIAEAAPRSGAINELRFHSVSAKIDAENGLAGQAQAHAMVAFSLQSRLYRDSLAGAIAGSQTAIALAEREVAAERLRKRNVLDRLAAQQALARVRLIWVASTLFLLAGSSGGVLWLRRRIRRAKDSEMGAERARLAADVHDTLVQGFIGISLQIRAALHATEFESQPRIAARLAAISTEAGTILAEARRAITNIRLRQQAAPQCVATAVQVLLESLHLPDHVQLCFETDPNLPSLAPERAEELRRVVGEAVTNALRHGRSSRIVVVLRGVGANIEAVISDQGCGFDPEIDREGRDHWGIRLMHERMARAGGTIEIHSAPGDGTTVRATVPCGAR